MQEGSSYLKRMRTTALAHKELKQVCCMMFTGCSLDKKVLLRCKEFGQNLSERSIAIQENYKYLN